MRRSALPFRSRASHCDAAIPMPPITRWAVAVALLLASAAASAASSSPWATATGEGVILPDGFRIPQDDVDRMEGPWENDVTPEDYVIDKLASFLQQARRDQERPRPQPPPEEEPYDDILSYDEDVGSQLGAREGQGPGFTYHFSDAVPSSTFAVNPSDPRYYSAADGLRSVETRGEDSASEGGSPEDEVVPKIHPPGRFPEVKPIKVLISTGTEIPPLPEYWPENMRQRPPHNDPIQEHPPAAASEQVKREERPAKVPAEGKYDIYVTAFFVGCSAAAVVGAIAAGIFWYKLQRNAKAAADVEYPAYGVTGPNQEASAVAAAAAAASVTPPPGPTGGSTSPLSAGDRRLAQSAQMYHYQHQKQQIIAMERASNDRHGSVSEVDSEEENEEGDYTVYECPGLAPTGEMEVKNPLFHDDPTPATPSGVNREQRDAGNKQ